MTQGPYVSARRVFWIVDNGSSHRGTASVQRRETAWPNLRVVHLPVHASWLNQIEIYFSIVQRKVLTPSDFSSLQVLASTILAFQGPLRTVATPFAWKFTREKLAALMTKLSQPLPEPLARCA
jgi:transposase